MVARNEIEVLYSEERPGLLKRVARRLGSQSTAADIVQDVFLRLWERDSGNLDSDVAYLRRSVSNAIVDHVRAERVRSAYAANILPEQCASPIPTPYDITEIRDVARQLDDVIRAMPERTRHIFLLNKVHGCKYSEIAEALGISRSAVEKHMARAMVACVGFQEESL
ncbi:sigma-70 family RNA polymerase sigma factor [Ochrobactrum sp. Marseille-Q0166]|uniref:RNA polymerase sigma factor n=1 Tax=Ochrobactrum sp. Marseille-Q0166 TaxID=2761105 RepID=UPI001656448F|nr:sigma-70 family RNA polymerase sigma factor [Ochrobactrum sp. Marseille-Q0166]MBC8719930.1 sigma-70 family RNA polymerase sigma factor [Ochrobactrum sp. Marseille-Q0166]